VALPDPGSEDGSPAASQRAIGKKKLVRFVRGGLAARMKDTRRGARCRATSQDAFGEKDLAMQLLGMIAAPVTPSAKSEETLAPQSKCDR
jgi:hypothetical protein